MSSLIQPHPRIYIVAPAAEIPILLLKMCRPRNVSGVITSPSSFKSAVNIFAFVSINKRPEAVVAAWVAHRKEFGEVGVALK